MSSYLKNTTLVPKSNNQINQSNQSNQSNQPIQLNQYKKLCRSCRITKSFTKNDTSSADYKYVPNNECNIFLKAIFNKVGHLFKNSKELPKMVGKRYQFDVDESPYRIRIDKVEISESKNNSIIYLTQIFLHNCGDRLIEYSMRNVIIVL